jgi:glycosyltransferase involved in cell wall biosynthesis
MRVLYFYQYFTVPEGSYSTRVYEFARRWVANGDKVTVVTSVYDKSGIKPDKLISRLNIAGIDVRMINIRLSNKHGFFVRILSFVAYALMATWYALVTPADVVVSSSGPLTVGIPGLIARWVRRLPFVIEVRDLWPEGAIQLGILRSKIAIRGAKLLEKACYHSAKRVIALSEGMAEWIRNEYGIDHIDVITNASDNELVEKVRSSEKPVLPSWTAGKELFIYTGTLGLIDDCGQILDVARIIQQRGITSIEFVLIGDGKERAQLQRKADELRLGNVHFMGSMGKEAVMQWLLASHCALFTVKDVPFLATASPNKVFDAFAAGTPIIQATDGWIKSLIDREQCGITVAPNDPHAMASAVQLLANDFKLRDELAKNALRVAHEQFDRSLLAGRMRKILQTAVRANKGQLAAAAIELKPAPTTDTMSRAE